MVLSLERIAGLMDSDGCVELQLVSNKEAILKYKAQIVVSITNCDYALLKDVKKTFNCGNIYADKNAYVYRITGYTNSSMIQSKLRHLFRGSVRKEMPFWERGIYLAQNGAFKVRGKTNPSFEEIREYIYLMYSMNTQGKQRRKTKEEWLKLFNLEPLDSFDSIAAKLQKDFSQAVPIELLTGEYVSGFCHGDGCFSLNNIGRFCPNFSVTDKDRDILELICDFLKLPEKTIFAIDPKTSVSNITCYRLQLNRFEICKQNIIPQFDKYPVLHYYKERYDLWRKGIMLQQDKKTTAQYNMQVDRICNQLKSLKHKVIDLKAEKEKKKLK